MAVAAPANSLVLSHSTTDLQILDASKFQQSTSLGQGQRTSMTSTFTRIQRHKLSHTATGRQQAHCAPSDQQWQLMKLSHGPCRVSGAPGAEAQLQGRSSRCCILAADGRLAAGGGVVKAVLLLHLQQLVVLLLDRNGSGGGRSRGSSGTPERQVATADGVACSCWGSVPRPWGVDAVAGREERQSLGRPCRRRCRRPRVRRRREAWCPRRGRGAGVDAAVAAGVDAVVAAGAPRHAHVVLHAPYVPKN